MAIPHPYLLGIGVVLLAIGIWCWRWSSRHAIDLKGAAIGAAFQGAIKRQIPDVPGDIKSKIEQVTAEQTNFKRAQKVGTLAARHFAAQAVWVAALVSLAGGMALVAAGLFWK